MLNQRKTNYFLAKFAQKISAQLAFFNHCFSVTLVLTFSMKSTVFSSNLSLKIPQNLAFFCDLSEALCYERFMGQVLDLVTFLLSLLPHFFPSRTPVMSNLDQSYFKRSERLHYIRSVKEWTKCPAFLLTGQILFLTGHCPLTGHYYKP